MQAAGLKLKPSKCEFFKDRITYLGHIVSKKGIETDPKKIQVIKDWPIPKTVTDVRSFLGFTNYYRKFMVGHTKIARPLNELISGENASRKNRPVKWSEEHQEAFERLKKLSTTVPILAYASYQKTFRVYTDTSEKGLGVVLSQVQENGKESAIAYASRTLNKSKRKYDPHKLEFLALKWAITDRFHEYLYGGSFDVYTDNNLLTYVLTTAKLDAIGQRWMAALGTYNFQIFYRSGKSNGNADALSRIPWKEINPKEYTLEDGVVVASIVQRKGDIEVPQGEDTLICKAAQFFSPDYAPRMTIQEWKHLQEEDLDIKKVVDLLKMNQLIHYRNNRQDTNEFKSLMKSKHHLKLIEGILYQTVQLKHQPKEVQQLVLPKPIWKRMVLACHDKMGHMGMDQVLLR